MKFLNDRLDVDAEHANAVQRSHWEDRAAWEGLAWGVVYFARWFGPDRALAEIAAKRLIIQAHPITTDVVGYGMPPEQNQGYGCETCHDWDGVTQGYGYCDTLKALAAPYAHDPNDSEMWRP